MKNSELTVIERAEKALGSVENKKKLADLVEQSKAITEIKNTAAREQCHSAAMALRTRRTDIRKTGKEARDDATKFSKAVIAEEDALVAIIEPEEQRLLVLRDAWDEKVAAEKRAKAEAEAKRVAQIRGWIEEFRRAPGSVPGLSSAELDEHADDLSRQPVELDRFMELTGEAQAARDASVDALREMANKARQREAEEARIKAEREELARLRAEQEERDRAAAAARAEQEAIDRAAREAEEAKRREEREAEEARLRAEREAHEQRMAAERAEFQRRQDEAAAEQRRAAAELQRQQDELAAERRRAADEEARKQREVDAATAKALQERLDAEARAMTKRQAEFAALQKAAPALLGACRQFVTATDAADEQELENAYQAAMAAIAIATPEEVPA